MNGLLLLEAEIAKIANFGLFWSRKNQRTNKLFDFIYHIDFIHHIFTSTTPVSTCIFPMFSAPRERTKQASVLCLKAKGGDSESFSTAMLLILTSESVVLSEAEIAKNS